MPLLLQPVKAEDAKACNKVLHAAFAGPFTDMMWRNGRTEADDAWEHNDIVRTVEQRGQNGVWMFANKIVDTDLPDDDPLNKIISYAGWTFMPHNRSQEDLAGQEHAEHAAGHPPSRYQELYEASLGQMNRQRAELWGKKRHAELNLLVVLPQHQRRGAGHMQLQWGVSKADEEHLPLWVEATPAGEPLYERYGWKAVGKARWDVEKFGLPPMDPTNMERPAKHHGKLEQFVEGVKRMGGGPGILSTPL